MEVGDGFVLLCDGEAVVYVPIYIDVELVLAVCCKKVGDAEVGLVAKRVRQSSSFPI